MGSRLRDTRESAAKRRAIGKTLHRLRTETALDVNKIAKRAGVGPMTWRRWESGESSIPAERLAQLAKIFNCSIVYLLTAPKHPGTVPESKPRKIERQFSPDDSVNYGPNP